MRRILAVLVAWSLVSAAPARADDAEVKAVIDKAVEALGGEEALAGAGAFEVAGRVEGQERQGRPFEASLRCTVQGPASYRLYLYHDGRDDFLGEPDMVWAGGPGARDLWYFRPSGGNLLRRDADYLVGYDKTLRQHVASFNLAPLLDGASKVERAGEGSVDGRPAVLLKVAPPDGGGFTMSFDKESGLPVEQSFPGRHAVRQARQTTSLRDYKDFGGLKVATHRVTAFEVRGTKMAEVFQVLGFTPLGRVDPATFAKPESVEAWRRGFHRENAAGVPPGRSRVPAR